MKKDIGFNNDINDWFKLCLIIHLNILLMSN